MVLRAILGAIRINIRRRIHKENRSLWQHQFEKKQSSSSITIQSIRRPLKNQKRVKKRVLGRHISSPPSRAGWITKSNQPRGDHKSNSDSARGARIVLGCIIHVACGNKLRGTKFRLIRQIKQHRTTPSAITLARISLMSRNENVSPLPLVKPRDRYCLETLKRGRGVLVHVTHDPPGN